MGANQFTDLRSLITPLGWSNLLSLNIFPQFTDGPLRMSKRIFGSNRNNQDKGLQFRKDRRRGKSPLLVPAEACE